MRFALFVLLTFSLILEVSLTTIPLLLIVLNSFLALYKRAEIAVFAFVFGIMIDILSFREVGISALFFIVFLFLVLLYQRKFEIKTFSFVAISTFLGSFLYLFIVNLKPLILESIVGSIIAVLFFMLLQKGQNYG